MTKKTNKLEKKQNNLNLKLNEFLTNKKNSIKGLPDDIYVVPVSDDDNILFKRSIKLFDKAKEEGRNNVFLAVLSGKNQWRFLSSL